MSNKSVEIDISGLWFIGWAILFIFFYGSPDIWDGITCHLLPDHCEYLNEQDQNP